MERLREEKVKRDAERDAKEAAKHAETAEKMEEAAKAEAARKEATEEAAAAAEKAVAEALPEVSSGSTFPCEELKGMGKSDGIDPTKKELYLEDAEFEKVFEMTRAAFGELKLLT